MTYKRGNEAKENTIINFKPQSIKVNDLVSQIFGKLTVIKYLGLNYRRHSLWLCQCECGNLTNASSYHLKKGTKNSCGCLTKERIQKEAKQYHKARMLPLEVIGLNSVISRYKGDAKIRKIDFLLTKEEVYKLIIQNCAYCGISPLNKIDFGERGIFYSNGIDRIDSNGMYTIDNCCTACEQCNLAKSDYTKIEFFEWIKRLYNKLEKDKKI